MTDIKLEKYIDHTMLAPIATADLIKQICLEAQEYNFKAVCIPSSFVPLAYRTLKTVNTKIVTVIGFPLGYNSTDTKIYEAKNAIENGCDEIDMVINLVDLKSKNYIRVAKEISDIKNSIGNKCLKVIVETCYLTEQEKEKVCQLVMAAEADFIKTSTGFSIDGAKIDDVKLFRKILENKVKIKASGGIKTREQALSFIEAGAQRIGTSNSIAIIS